MRFACAWPVRSLTVVLVAAVPAEAQPGLGGRVRPPAPSRAAALRGWAPAASAAQGRALLLANGSSHSRAVQAHAEHAQVSATRAQLDLEDAKRLLKQTLANVRTAKESARGVEDVAANVTRLYPARPSADERGGHGLRGEREAHGDREGPPLPKEEEAQSGKRSDARPKHKPATAAWFACLALVFCGAHA
mmetsp:Transcript_48799/g.156056  ORF Transcript_48799/g.156056 Transcript_48799/m.156056 type:complete len:191 (+) Transcript_48799:99-671(+)